MIAFGAMFAGRSLVDTDAVMLFWASGSVSAHSSGPVVVMSVER